MSVRYPFADLAAAMSQSEHQAAVRLGLSGSTEQEYRRRGMTERVADRLAVKAGLHPFEVWPEMLAQFMSDLAQFDDDTKNKKDERRRASWRRYAAKRRQERPEEMRARDAAYYAECAEYVKARARRRYQADVERQRAARRERYARNREAELERQRGYYAANAERLRAAERVRKAARRAGTQVRRATVEGMTGEEAA